MLLATWSILDGTRGLTHIMSSQTPTCPSLRRRRINLYDSRRSSRPNMTTSGPASHCNTRWNVESLLSSCLDTSSHMPVLATDMPRPSGLVHTNHQNGSLQPRPYSPNVYRLRDHGRSPLGLFHAALVQLTSGLRFARLCARSY